ncbi:MAG: PA0069 family radical SAM protein [Planctomycetota bacterium]
MPPHDAQPGRPAIRGRGAQSQPACPYVSVELVSEPAGDATGFAPNGEFLPPHPPPATEPAPATEFLADQSWSIVSENRSPDIPFRYSVNPYRGCEHGCSYCYARPTHEYLGMSAGLDFETRILVKHDAAALFRRWLARESYTPETVMFSGVTDCYQPIERRLGLTRQCLRVAAECRQPVSCVTKNALVARDLDLWADLAGDGCGGVAVSLTTLDEPLARDMEPRTSSPAARLRAIERLSAAGVPVHAMLAPLIPGLTDAEAPALLKAAHSAGARTAGYLVLRLPATVEAVFLDWLRRRRPNHYPRVVALIQGVRGGKMNDPRFHSRMRGEGAYADQLSQTVAVVAKRLGLAARQAPLRTDRFVRPTPPGAQRRLF